MSWALGMTFSHTWSRLTLTVPRSPGDNCPRAPQLRPAGVQGLPRSHRGGGCWRALETWAPPAMPPAMPFNPLSRVSCLNLSSSIRIGVSKQSSHPRSHTPL